MTEQELGHNLAGAECFQLYSTLPDTLYWEGYEHGLRRHYNGDKYGTAEEHSLWMVPVGESGDEQQRFRGIGYRTGFEGMPIAEAIKHLQVTVAKRLAAVAAGSVRSEAKAAAARENAKRPRPNAQGKKKPRAPKEPALRVGLRMGEHLGAGNGVCLGKFHGWGTVLIDTDTWVIYSKESYSNVSELTATARPSPPKSESDLSWYRWAKKVLDGVVCTGTFKQNSNGVDHQVS
jgi:hypothetical protein